MKTRLALTDDAPEVSALFHAYRQWYGYRGDESSSKHFISERLRNGDSAILVAENSKVVGFSQLYPLFSSVSACSIMLLNDLFVDESHRGDGVGTALLSASRNLAEERGAKRLLIATQKTNTGAAKLYTRFGFILDTEFDNFTLSIDSKS